MADDTFVLPHMLEIYVPTQCRCGEQLPDSLRKQAVDTIKKQMAQWFGGVTSSDAQGGWVLASGQLAEETVTIIYSNVGDEQLQQRRSEFTALAQKMADDLSQEAIAYAINKKMSFVDGDPEKSCMHQKGGARIHKPRLHADMAWMLSLESTLRSLPADQKDKYQPDLLERARNLFCHSLGYSYANDALPVSRWTPALRKLSVGQKAPMIIARGGENFQIILLQLNNPRLLLTEQRQLIERILRDQPSLRALFLVTDSDGTQWHLVNIPEHSPTNRRLIRRFRIDQANQPMRTVVEQLAGINLEILGEKADDTQIKAAHDRAFDVQAVTDTFYKTFREVFEFTRSRVQGIQNEEQLHLFTQQLFNRLLFLSFIDKKGWLNLEGKGGYFDRLWHNYQAPRKNKSTSTPNFYRERLEPLFFEALNTPHNADMSEKDYADLQSMLQNSGTVPDKAVLEKSGTSPARLKKLEKLIGKTPFLNGGLFEKDEVDKYKELHIPDECFSTIFKKLFAAFNFTVMESTPFDEDVAIDPEMLGRVFEELVVGRHSTGSYYTPKSIVSFMCHEALKGYLESRIPGVDKEALELFVDDYDASKIKSRAEEVLDALRAVTVCDPACGSGAYLLGMLQELIHLRAALFDVAQLDSRTAYKRKLEIIHNNLYGTDLEIFAVNIARLRLWLSLIVEYEGDTPPPLPNLDFKIESGDSLLGPPIQQRSGEQLEFFDNTDKITLLAQGLKKKKEAYLRAQGAIKELVKKGISKQEEAIQKALQDSKFKRRDGKPVIFWHVHFFEVFADGGFDVVLANPPYVRQEQISEEKARLKEVFPEVYSGKADLFCFFYARAVEMLKPGGMFVFISPNKWFKAGYGSGLRTLMKNTCEVRQIIDFNDLPVFKSAVAYPMIFIAKKHEEGVEDFKQEFLFTDVTTLAPPYPDVKELVRQNAVSIPDMAIDEKRWLLMDPSILNKIAKMDEVGVPLKTYLKDCAINRGIVTGFNRAFFINGETRQKLIDEDPRSEEIIKPLIQGKDVKKWHVESRDQWIIFAKQGIDIDQYPAVKSHLAQWKKELTPKPKKASKGKKGRASGTYKWYELQSSIAYEAKLSQTKIVYPVIAQKPCFALDREHHYLNDKAFMIPLDDPYLLGVLNSEAVWFYLKAVCSPLQNNFIELRSPYILNLPVPDASAEEQKHLSGLVSKLLKSKAQTRVKLEQEINSFVDKLYGF